MMLWKISKKLNNWLYILDYHEQLLKNLQNTNQTEPITGLLLVYMKHLVHVMEVSMSHDYSFLFFPVCLNFYLPFPPSLSPPPPKKKPVCISLISLIFQNSKLIIIIFYAFVYTFWQCSADAIMAVVRDMKESKSSKKGFLENSKILVISHDIQNRLYQQWSFRQLDIVAARIESIDSNEPTEKVVIDLVTQLLKLGNALAKTPKVSHDLKGLEDKFDWQFFRYRVCRF